MFVLSEVEKCRIAGRARTVQERLDTGRGTAGDDLDGAIADYLDEWRERVVDGDPDAFRERLRYEGVDVATCRRRLADDWPDDRPLPEWIDRLDEILAFVQENRSVTLDLRTEVELPFVDVLAPFLAYARSEVRNRPAEYVARSGELDLLGWLARRMTRIWSHTLFVEFKTHVASHDPDLVFDDDVEIPEGSTTYYDEFTEQLLADGLRSFFLEYSFLARLIVTSIDQWVARVEEFYARLSDDWTALCETFAAEGRLGKLTAVDATGDTHQGGREVLGVTFDSGTKVAYKPRNAGIVVGFYDLLSWVNANGDLPALRTLDFVARDRYAWMEWVRPQPCTTETEVESYYRRAGMLMCLFYALAATDMHLENIVAEGGQPVSIDLETLAEPVPKAEFRAINETVKVVADTVVRTGVVPRHVPSEESGDMSGFAAHRGEIRMEGQRFTDRNTDRMDLVRTQLPDIEGANLPVYDGAVVEPREHTGAIVRGFGEMYRFVLANEGELLAEDGPVASFVEHGARVRVLYRATSVYGHVIDSMRSPSAQRRGLQFGVTVEALAKLIVAGTVDRSTWPLYAAERDTLRRFDVPRFSAKLDSPHLYDRREVVVADFFEGKPIDQIRERIRSLDEADCQEQLDYVRWGYGGHEDAHTTGGQTAVDDLEPERATFEREAEAAAEAVFDRIVANARTENGDPTWILREIGPEGGLHVHPIEDRLYDGRVGIGLFAAGLSAVHGDDRFEAFAASAVAPILASIEAGDFANDPSSSRHPPRPVGGGVGLGSIVYGLTKMGELLSDDWYLRAATNVAALIEPDRIEADDRYGVLAGSAGAILGLLALQEATGDGDLLDRSRRAGEHLLANRTRRDGVATWCAPDVGQPLCGFSHGVAGIAYALHRLGAAAGESRFERAALAAIEFERERWDPVAENWPDLRVETESDWMDAWCHGRTGVGLARLGMYETDPRPGLRRDVDRALGGVDLSTLSTLDHVCCGNFGRVELLLRAGRTFDEPRFGRQAIRLASASVRRADRAGQFATQWQTDRLYNPAFFGGEAGVGYSLLRVLDRSLPCVLLWE